MYIRNLHIKNFKNSKDINLKFNKFNVISGETGEGKTAIVEAITFLLTNYLQDKIDEYIRWGQDSFTVETDFDFLGKNYTYWIQGEKGATNRELIVDDNDIFQKSDAVKELATIIDPKLTLYSNIALQHKSTELLFENPTPRLQKIKAILKIDAVGDIVELIKDDIKSNKQKIEILEAEINTLKSQKFEVQEEIVVPSIDIQKYNEKKEQLEKDRQIYVDELKQYEVFKEREEQYKKAISKINELRDVIEKIESDIDTLNNKKKNIDDFNYSDYEEISKLIENNKNYNSILRKLSQVKREVKNLSIIDIGECPYSNDQVKEIYDKIAENEANIKAVNQKISIAKEGKCYTCGQDYTVSIDGLQADLVTLQKENDTLIRKRDEMEKAISDHEDSIRENNIVKEKFDFFEKEITEYEKELSQYTEPEYDITELNKKHKELLQQKEDYEKYNDYNKKIDKEINEKDKELIGYHSLLTEYLSVEEPKKFEFSVSFNENEYKETCDIIVDYNSKVREAKQVEKFNEQIIENKKVNQKNIKIKEKELNIIRGENSVLTDTQKILDKDFSSWLIDSGSSYIKEQMNVFFQKGYGKYQIEFKQDGKGIDFFYSNGKDGWRSVNMLSGFEKQIFSVAFRVALNKLQDLNILVVDEIDSDASDKRSLQLYTTIVNEPFDQVFIISHNDSTKEFFRNLPECSFFEIKEGELV